MRTFAFAFCLIVCSPSYGCPLRSIHCVDHKGNAYCTEHYESLPELKRHYYFEGSERLNISKVKAFGDVRMVLELTGRRAGTFRLWKDFGTGWCYFSGSFKQRRGNIKLEYDEDSRWRMHYQIRFHVHIFWIGWRETHPGRDYELKYLKRYSVKLKLHPESVIWKEKHGAQADLFDSYIGTTRCRVKRQEDCRGVAVTSSWFEDWAAYGWQF